MNLITHTQNLDLKGRLEANVALAPFSWFKVGGPAEYLFRPQDSHDLETLLKNLPENIPVTLLGAASNMLIRDGGIKGLVIRLGRGFAQMQRLNETDVYVGAAVPDMNAAKFLCQEALEGGAFLRGIPGTIGGALKMNAGAYGRELCDIFLEAHGITQDGHPITLTSEDMGFKYRHSNTQDIIFTGVKLRLKPSSSDVIATQMEEITQKRQETQPVKSHTGGSTFKNPTQQHRAWALIDAAGCRGMSFGKAHMSNLHCNFMINEGGATAYDLEVLGEKVRETVYQHAQILLEWEIKRLGYFLPHQTNPEFKH